MGFMIFYKETPSLSLFIGGHVVTKQPLSRTKYVNVIISRNAAVRIILLETYYPCFVNFFRNLF